MHHCHVALSVVINFSHFRLVLWSGIQRILTGRKISTSSTKFLLIGPIEKKNQTRWPPRHLTDCDIFDFSSETTEWNSTKLEREQDLNVLYQVCGFRADRKDKMATPVSDWLRHSQLLLCDRYLEFNETWKGARSKRPLPRLCFSGRLEKQDGHTGFWGWDILGFSSETDEWNSTKFTGSKIPTSSITFVFFGSIGGTR